MPVIQLSLGGKLYDDINEAFDGLTREVSGVFDKGSFVATPLLLRSLQAIADEMKRLHGNPWAGTVVNPSNQLQSRSGQGLKELINSIRVQAGSGDLMAVGQISAGSLSIHEEGGTIKASGSGYLTIPLPAAMDSRGVPLRQRARDWDNTFVRRSKKGALLIFRKLPSAKQLTPLYILKTSVYIRPRLGMEPAVDTQMGYFENKLFEELADMLERITL